MPRGEQVPTDSCMSLRDLVTRDGDDCTEVTLFADIKSVDAFGWEVAADEERLGRSSVDHCHKAVLPVDEDAIDVKGDGI